MNFLKKNSIYLIIAIILIVVFSVPSIRNVFKNQFFPLATAENFVKLNVDDYNVELKGINVADANLKDFKNKTLFLNFWGTWCPPCVKEFPSIQKLYDLKKDKLNFVLIAMQDEEENVKQFLSKNQYTVPVYVAKSPISEKILPKVFPTTFLIYTNQQILKKVDYSENWVSDANLQFIDNIVP